MDFFIILMAILEKLINFQNISMIRNFRILRPLRTIVKLESLKKILETIF
jgi:hypothetical protein